MYLFSGVNCLYVAVLATLSNQDLLLSVLSSCSLHCIEEHRIWGPVGAVQSGQLVFTSQLSAQMVVAPWGKSYLPILELILVKLSGDILAAACRIKIRNAVQDYGKLILDVHPWLRYFGLQSPSAAANTANGQLESKTPGKRTDWERLVCAGGFQDVPAPNGD